MMKNLLLTAYTGFPQKTQGGPNRVIFELLDNLDNSKFNLRYISKDFDHDFSTDEDIEKIIQNQLSVKKTLSNSLFKQSQLFKKLVASPAYLKHHYYNNNKLFNQIENKIKLNPPDVINSHDVRSMFYFLSSPGKKILTIHSKGRIKQDVRDYVLNTKLLRKEIEHFEKMERLSLEKSDIITFPSNAAKDLFFQGNLNPYEEKTRIIYNGINIDRINSIPYDPDILKKHKIVQEYDVFLLSVADHIKTKNVDVLIEVVKHLKNDLHKNPLLVNIGKGPETPYLLDLIEKYGLKNNVVLISMIENDDVIRFMKKCDYFISLGERVVFDMVILEAMASGAIVIAMNDGGNREIIQNHQNGYFVYTQAVKEVNNILQAAQKEIKFRAIETASRYSTQKMVTEYMNLYER